MRHKVLLRANFALVGDLGALEVGSDLAGARVLPGFLRYPAFRSHTNAGKD